MQKKLVDEAYEEAKRFIGRVDVMRRACGIRECGKELTYDYGSYTAATRRASMDLTKALARMRRG